MSKLAVDRAFIERGDEQLNVYESRSYARKTFVALFIDGKYLLGPPIVLASGVTAQGEKPRGALCKAQMSIINLVWICSKTCSNAACGAQ